ncbi:CrcB family protein [Phytomonospora sp. NPDC050363]|uniref:fluoride efflux transporter FluC n=1 Tax=Phytomonospora sp. NPDC050363 TaxID=3155642 RepID=UPI0033DAE935
MMWLLVALGAAVGAPLRYLADHAIRSLGPRWTGFPWGTLLVNVVGSALLGGLTGAAVSSEAYALAGSGFCGALTTFSSFGSDTIKLIEGRRGGRAAVYVAVTVAAGLAASAGAFALMA